MPFVLKHRETSQIYACTMLNAYDIPYYGVKAWMGQTDLSANADVFIQANGLKSDEWEPLEVGENRLKIMNVKLKNDPSLDIYMDMDDKLDIRKKA